MRQLLGLPRPGRLGKWPNLPDHCLELGTETPGPAPGRPRWRARSRLEARDTSKRRRLVVISEQLRADVAQTARDIRQMLASGELPPPLVAEQAAKRCKACSLLERCQPQATHAGLLAARSALFDPDS